MTAILILIVAALCAWGYGKLVGAADSDTMMEAGPILICIPWLVIVVGTIVALVVFT